MKNPFKKIYTKISYHLHKRKLRQIRKKQQKEYDRNKANAVYNHPTNINNSPIPNDIAVAPPPETAPLSSIDDQQNQVVTENVQQQDVVPPLKSILKPTPPTPKASVVTPPLSNSSNSSSPRNNNNSTAAQQQSSPTSPQIPSPAFEDQLLDYKKLQRERYEKMAVKPTNSSSSSSSHPLPPLTAASLVSSPSSSTSSPSYYKHSPSSKSMSKAQLLKKASVSGMKSKYTVSQYKDLDFTSKDGCLWVNDHVFKLKGVNWFGCETETSVVHGLWSRDYKQYLEFLAVNNFNAIRIPFSLELVLKDPFPTSISITPHMNTDLHGLRALSVLDIIIEAAGEKGMFVLLDLHSFGPNDRLHDGLWYNSQYSEQDTLKAWYILILRYGKMWNVLGVDLKNEPYSATWNTGNNLTDWDKAINRIASYIQSNGGHRWLIFAQGVPSQQHSEFACCWGESFESEGRPHSTISIPNEEKFVYSPHCYGPSVVNHAHFRMPGFPNNMIQHWDVNFGNLPTTTKRAVVVGEFGGRYTEQLDRIWMDCFVQYLRNKGCTDNFYWCLNPNSGDTGGLLKDDWISINQEKLELLHRLCPHPTKIQYDKDTRDFTIISHIKNNKIKKINSNSNSLNNSGGISNSNNSNTNQIEA